jgi:hypothetical protein
MAEILDGTNLNTSVFSYSAPRLHESGGKVVRLLNGNTRGNLQFTTPLILTWGASETLEPITMKPLGKYSMSLQFPTDEYSTPSLVKFLESMRALEAKIKSDALSNSLEWFGKKHTSIDVIDALFNPMLKHPKIKGTQTINHEKPPTLNVKVPCYDGQWKSEIYDEERNPLFIPKVTTDSTPLDYLVKMSHLVCLLECSGIWFVNGKFSVTWTLKQAVVQSPKLREEGICQISLSADDKARLTSGSSEAVASAMDKEASVDAEIGCAVVDSDVEDEDDLPVASASSAPPMAAVVAPAVVAPTVATPVPAAAAPVKRKVVKKVVK